MKTKKIIFLTGTRADFGKLKPLMKALDKEKDFEVHIFVTGMHMFPKYGSTGDEIDKSGFKNTFHFINQQSSDSIDCILANTIYGLRNYVSLIKPDMLIIHGDRVEALAGAIVGAFNNILVSHIEGGEVSGTIDESIRHSITKLSHIHFVANNEAKGRLVQMGEDDMSIHVIGSPDIDLMSSRNLPSSKAVKKYYEIAFDKYAIFMYHPVTTNLHNLLNYTQEIMNSLIESGKNYIAIYPNNDPGSDIIIEELELLRKNPRFRILPSMRFEAFLTLLKSCDFIIGNSSTGIREAPFYGVPSINIGNRQNRRFAHETILDVGESKNKILSAIKNIKNIKCVKSGHFGDGKSTERFKNIIRTSNTWKISIQKNFVDRF
ncbi:MAG: UDP-N-acetylglucosamine 2-epimerase (hydrolyzing) [Candidatus Omnitrophica bacterium]|nr:UDP-N-acetylglucosamine 2-epimerase (hydrolyzing) [Candidatus Omnitrophota bacterium]